MFGTSSYIAAGLAIVIVLLQVYWVIVTDKLYLEAEVLTAKLIVKSLNNVTLKGVIDSSNDRIRLQEIDVELAEAELAEWKAKPVEVRYKTIYKNIPQWVDVRKDSCDNTKSIINAARLVDYGYVK